MVTHRTHLFLICIISSRTIRERIFMWFDFIRMVWIYPCGFTFIICPVTGSSSDRSVQWPVCPVTGPPPRVKNRTVENRFKFYRLNLPVKNLPVENLPVDNLPVKNFTGSKNNQLVKKETLRFIVHVYTTLIILVWSRATSIKIGL